MFILNSIQKFLQFLFDNWTAILVCIGLIIGLIQRTKHWFSKSKEERYLIAKQQIKEIILGKITFAENSFAEWNKSGSIKRSQVIDEIYSQYPILGKIVDQSEVIAWLDKEIDDALKTLKDVIKENKQTDNE